MAGKPTAACIARLNKELQQLDTEPPPGISAWPKDGQINQLEASIQGPKGTPYEGGTFKLQLDIPDRYPFEPPKVRFVTPIYHPNIDSQGRICLDTLNMPPKGDWKPAVNVATVLSTIHILMAEPNPEDGLMADITAEYKTNRGAFEATARALTLKHAADTSNSTLPCHDARGDAGSGVGGRPDEEEEAEESEEDEDEDAIASMWGKPAGRGKGEGAQEEVQDSEEEGEEGDLFANPVMSSSAPGTKRRLPGDIGGSESPDKAQRR